MDLKLSFNIENSNNRKDLLFICTPDEDVQRDFAAEIRKLWPKLKLPSTGSMSFKEIRVNNAGGIELNCRKPLTVNGVAVQSRILKKGDRIIFGPLRLNYLTFEMVKTGTDAAEEEDSGQLKGSLIQRIRESDFKFNWKTHPLRAAALIVTISAACIIAGCLAIPDKPIEELPVAELAADKTPVVHRKTRTVPAVSAASRTIPEESTIMEESEEGELTIVPPGGITPDYDLDILFIHAHPDDEALDFGCLMALAETAGLKTGLITFTDGESGLDVHPFRPSTGIYPAYSMRGSELSAVREIELQRSARILGVDILIRLGLQNNPYNSLRDVLPPEEIIAIWGGEQLLTDKILEVIDRTRPETIVAPDAPAAAREHFEHEAVGYLASEIMSGFSIDDYKAPKRFITCVDPRQQHLYPDASAIDAGLRPGAAATESVSLRQVQLTALQMHKTQNDAVNVGTGFLPKYPAEYYQIQYWHSNLNWNDWIAGLAD